MAWSDGRLSTDQARHLFAAAEAVPDLYPEAEEALVEIVEGLDAADTGRTVAYWRQAMEGPGNGTTSVDNGKLFCRPCHIREHLKQRRTQGWLFPTTPDSGSDTPDARTSV